MSAEKPTRTKLTQSVVDSAQYTSTGQRSVFDTKTPGFFLRIGKRTKTFTLQRDFRGDAKRVTVRRALGRADGDDAITVAAVGATSASDVIFNFDFTSSTPPRPMHWWVVSMC